MGLALMAAMAPVTVPMIKSTPTTAAFVLFVFIISLLVLTNLERVSGRAEALPETP
jgi:hypothetical protein